MLAKRCSVEGCDGQHSARGFCSRHYMAFRRHGDPTKSVQTQHHGKTLEERFWLHVRKGRACWDWTGARNPKGYGVMRTGDVNTLAHRIAFQITNGPIAAGMLVLHRCDRPCCVNPAHLFLGTKAMNVADMDAKGRRRSAPCQGERNYKAKLTDQAVREIRASAERLAPLAERYGVTQALISMVRRRRIWRHVK